MKDPNCNMQAVIGTNQIDLTWDTSAKSKYDGMSRDELAKLNARGAWAAALAQFVARASSESETTYVCQIALARIAST